MKDRIVIDGANYTAPQLRAIIARAAKTLKDVGAEGVLEDLIRRDEMRNELDGWASGGGNGGIRGSEVARPTENTGLRLAMVSKPALAPDDERLPAPLEDPVHGLVQDIVKSTLALAGHVGLIELRTTALESRHGKLGRVSTTDSCQGCERTVACTAADPLVSGWCQACYKAFRRARDKALALGSVPPDRVAFNRSRREKAA